MKRIATIAVLAALAGCAPPPSYNSSNVYTGSVSPSRAATATDLSSPTIKNDPYKPSIEVRAEGAEKTDADLNAEIWGLYGKVDKKTGAVSTYVQWGEVYGDRAWRFYSSASTNKGESLSFTQVERNVSKCFPRLGQCTYSEVYNITIPQALLRSGAKDGISFKIFGKSGSERIVNIPADVVAQFNTKIAEASKMRGSG